MHVHHLRPLPLPFDPATELRSARNKKPVDDPDKVPPVSGRDEDAARQEAREEAREQQRRRQAWINAERNKEIKDAAAKDDGAAPFAETLDELQPPRADPLTAPSLGIDQLFAGIKVETAPAQVTKAEADPSIEDLLQLMRGNPPP